VIKEIDQALEAHELLKVRLGRNGPEEIDAAAAEIAKATRSFVAQTIGHVIVIYRPAADPDDRKIELPTRAQKVE
jgi:RNA-binding protein